MLQASKMSTAHAASFLSSSDVGPRVMAVIKDYKYSPDVVNENVHFVKDLEFDSMLVQNLINKLGAEFCVDIPSKDAQNIDSASSAINYFSTHPKAR